MSHCLIIYILHHKAYNAGAESTEIPAPNMSGTIDNTHIPGHVKIRHL